MPVSKKYIEKKEAHARRLEALDVQISREGEGIQTIESIRAEIAIPRKRRVINAFEKYIDNLATEWFAVGMLQEDMPLLFQIEFADMIVVMNRIIEAKLGKYKEVF